MPKPNELVPSANWIHTNTTADPPPNWDEAKNGKCISLECHITGDGLVIVPFSFTPIQVAMINAGMGLHLHLWTKGTVPPLAISIEEIVHRPVEPT